MAEAIFHIGMLGYKIVVLGHRLTMVPTLKDAKDVFDEVRYNLGLRRKPPQYPRYSYGEKAEYLAVVWGTLIMVLTGFKLWNPIAVTKIVPGAWLPAARAAHGAEALLAVASIVTWHMYSVHFKHFNRAMFTRPDPARADGRGTRRRTRRYRTGPRIPRTAAGHHRQAPALVLALCGDLHGRHAGGADLLRHV